MKGLYEYGRSAKCYILNCEAKKSPNEVFRTIVTIYKSRAKHTLVATALLLLLSTALTVAQDSRTKYSLRVGYLPATHDTLLFIAVHEKLFPPNLDVQLLKYSSSPDILNEMRGGSVDVAIPGVAAPIQRIAEGAPFAIVAGAAQESAAVVTKSDYKAKFFDGDQLRPLNDRIRAFANMKIGSVKLSTGDALFRCAIKDNKVPVSIDDSYHSPKDVLLDLKGGRLDAAVLWSPHMTTAEKDNMPIVLWLGEVLPNHVCCRQVVRQDYLAGNREAVVLYLGGLIRAKALYDASQKSAKHKQRVLEAVREYVLVDPKYPDVLEKELFGEEPRTKLSVDLNEHGIAEYLEKMAEERMISPAQVEEVKKGIDGSVLYDAYRKVGLSDDQAQIAMSKGFASVPEEARTQMLK